MIYVILIIALWLISFYSPFATVEYGDQIFLNNFVFNCNYSPKVDSRFYLVSFVAAFNLRRRPSESNWPRKTFWTHCLTGLLDATLIRCCCFGCRKIKYPQHQVRHYYNLFGAADWRTTTNQVFIVANTSHRHCWLTCCCCGKVPKIFNWSLRSPLCDVIDKLAATTTAPSRSLVTWLPGHGAGD